MIDIVINGTYSILGLSLFIGQAFLYNAITFGYAQILATYFHVTASPGYYFAIIACGNLAGPLLLGRFFDTVGRRPMTVGCYIASGLLLFFASAGASSAYLTVSEVFPVETRAPAIAFFYAIGTAAGGISGPLLFSSLVGTGKLSAGALAFCIGAAMMTAAGLVEIFLGVKAERQRLEDIATPLTASGDPDTTAASRAAA